MLDDLRGRLREEPARLPDQLAVGVDLSLAAKVADHVPVEAGAVDSAGLRERRPEGEVHRAADLLVEENVARPAVDLVVEAEGELADDARAVVDGQKALQVVV